MNDLLSVYEIREKYPHPVSVNDGEGGKKCYCVGGAFILAHPDAKKLAKMIEIDDINFPDSNELSRIIRFFYPDVKNIPQKCRSIVTSNDNGKFEQAWDTLADLVGYC